MKIVVLAEGHTENAALGDFFKRWLTKTHPKGAQVRVQMVNLKGGSAYVKDLPKKVALHLGMKDVCGVMGLLDLYGLDLPEPCPRSVKTSEMKKQWAKKHLESVADNARFRQHFAVHELEAWLISDPRLFPVEIGKSLAAKARHPEHVNSTTPPAKLLKNLYEKHAKRSYRKTTDGADLFRKLDPNFAASKCPALAALLDDMAALLDGMLEMTNNGRQQPS